ncbi:hypothetical protein PGT21_031166 [Puccinia graminis f. sp. tritici]|uniref:Secreted protein n=1 Tax=Puccinia graminis f. sp. tritici TaxID=56615 RepID=A0A5B0LZ81_PUCGR|nr:hypothetical protein PGT21_031166 [Puccinia graminis f. sp. tritici]
MFIVVTCMVLVLDVHVFLPGSIVRGERPTCPAAIRKTRPTYFRHTADMQPSDMTNSSHPPLGHYAHRAPVALCCRLVLMEFNLLVVQRPLKAPTSPSLNLAYLPKKSQAQFADSICPLPPAVKDQFPEQ